MILEKQTKKETVEVRGGTIFFPRIKVALDPSNDTIFFGPQAKLKTKTTRTQVTGYFLSLSVDKTIQKQNTFVFNS